MRRTNIYLDDEQTAALDDASRAAGVSRAELVRRYIDQSLERQTGDVDSDLAAIEGSFGVLDDVELPRRGPDERSRHLRRVAAG